MKPKALQKSNIFRIVPPLVFLILVLYNWSNSLPYQGPDDELLAPLSNFPNEWITGDDSQRIVEWSSDRGTWDSSGEAVFTDPLFYRTLSGSLWLAAQGYEPNSSTNTGIFVSQILKRHLLPMEASIKLLFLTPGKPETWGKASFLNSINQPALKPAVGTFRTKYATSKRVECIAGSLDTCEMWYIWLQYGEYILQINVRYPGKGTSISTIEPFVLRIDESVGQRLHSE